MSNQPNFPKLPIEVQVALINAAASIAVTKVTTENYNPNHNFFENEFQRICDSLYKENKGR